MLRTIIFYPCVVMTLVLSFIPSFRYRFVDSKPSNKKFNLSVYRISSAWARLMMRLSGARITVTGEEYLKEGETYYVSPDEIRNLKPLQCFIKTMKEPRYLSLKIEED